MGRSNGAYLILATLPAGLTGISRESSAGGGDAAASIPMEMHMNPLPVMATLYINGTLIVKSDSKAETLNEDELRCYTGMNGAQFVMTISVTKMPV